MVDRALILRKISELEVYQKQMKEFSDIALEAYKANWKTQRIVERTLQMMIETCVDIANRIVSDIGMSLLLSFRGMGCVLIMNVPIPK